MVNISDLKVKKYKSNKDKISFTMGSCFDTKVDIVLGPELTWLKSDLCQAKLYIGLTQEWLRLTQVSLNWLWTLEKFTLKVQRQS